MEDWSAVEACLHLHYADAGVGVPMQDRVLDGCCSSVAGKQGGMDVDHAARRERKDLWSQNMAIRDHDAELGLEPPETGAQDIAGRTHRLEDRNAMGLGGSLEGGRKQNRPGSSLGLVRLGDGGHDGDTPLRSASSDATAKVGVPKNTIRITPTGRAPPTPLWCSPNHPCARGATWP